MVKVQFMVKQALVVHCDLLSPTAEQELAQFAEQGFRCSGQVIDASSVACAYQRYQQQHSNDVDYPIWATLLDAEQYLGAQGQ